MKFRSYQLQAIRLARSMLIVIALFCAGKAIGQELTPGSYFWYVPEHEQYGRTTFYSQANFNSGTVRVTRTQGFKLIGGGRGWAQIEFEFSGKAFVHLRVLRNLMHDPAAEDPWREFKRASVFSQDPKVVEARLIASALQDKKSEDSKVPAWKRYKDGWGLKPGRSATAPSESDRMEVPAASSARTPAKPRSKHPLLPPIGSEPTAPTPETGEVERSAEEPTPSR